MKKDLKLRTISRLLNDPSINTMTLKAVKEYVFNSPQKAAVTQQWAQSNCTDFTAYSNPDYQWDLVDCYLSVSEGSIAHVLRYLQLNGHDWQNLSYFDDWNGNGLTTLDLIASGCQDVSFYNNVTFQAQSLLSTCQSEGFITPKQDITRQNQYDVVLSLQCVEHMTAPLDYVRELMQMTKVGGLLCMSVDGFSWTPDESIGHFWEYQTDDKTQFVKGPQMRKMVKEYLKNNGFDIIKGACWNANPNVFKRVK